MPPKPSTSVLEVLGDSSRELLRLAWILISTRAHGNKRCYAIHWSTENDLQVMHPSTLNSLITYLRFQILTSLKIGKRATIIPPNAPYPNLVSDSTLVQDTIDLLTVPADAPLRRRSSTPFSNSLTSTTNSRSLVAILRNRSRFKNRRKQHRRTPRRQHCDSCKDLDFVSSDVEATGAKTPPNRLIELGAYRIRGGRIVDKFPAASQSGDSDSSLCRFAHWNLERDGQARSVFADVCSAVARFRE
jgi:hypothetical protein